MNLVNEVSIYKQKKVILTLKFDEQAKPQQRHHSHKFYENYCKTKHFGTL